MVGRHRDPLRGLVRLIWLLCALIGAGTLLCWYFGVPSAEFWGR